VTGARVRIAAALDIAVILVFVAIGRRNHDEGSGFGEVLRIAAPFLIGLATGWIVARAWRRPFELVTGCTIWVVTVALGMVLRKTLFDRGTAVSFIIVASVFTGALLLGWRLVARRMTRRPTHQN
jgi:uncharacterized membrane protein YbjE (DUF340 family)